MNGHNGLAPALAHLVQRRLLWLLLAAYAAAALWPAAGLHLRGLSLGEAQVLGEPVHLSLPLALLAFLLFSAGLGAGAEQLAKAACGPHILCAGLAASVLLPLAFLLGLAQLLRSWHNPEEVQVLVAGLALVAAMPVAGSSAAWAQAVDGDLSLSLGLVLGSTLLSPLTTPVALHAAGWMTQGDYAEALHGVAGSGAGGLLMAGVVLPSLAGLGLGRRLGPAAVAAARPYLKLAGTCALLLLCYANAAVSLPAVLADPDWDFLAALVGATLALCVLCFAAGWCLARLLQADPARQTALMFGLGMSNNGTGLVLAGTTLAGYPRLLLPLILYNLVQHLMAGAVGATFARPARAPA
jgi:BASS family bile acid:Na+ symporter